MKTATHFGCDQRAGKLSSLFPNRFYGSLCSLRRSRVLNGPTWPPHPKSLYQSKNSFYIFYYFYFFNLKVLSKVSIFYHFLSCISNVLSCKTFLLLLIPTQIVFFIFHHHYFQFYFCHDNCLVLCWLRKLKGEVEGEMIGCNIIQWTLKSLLGAQARDKLK